MELTKEFDPFKRGWQLTSETSDAWALSFFNGHMMIGTKLHKAKVYRAIAEAAFWWLL